MAREILNIAVGQCGNQIALEYWNKVAKLLRIQADGNQQQDISETLINTRLNTILKEVDHNKYIPRAIFLDLEPRVITSIKNMEYGNLLIRDNCWMGVDGGGAGNIWAVGYRRGHENINLLHNMIDKELEASDSVECITITHSICGGTGSGLGSFILDLLHDLYPKKLIQTYSVIPNATVGNSDVVVQPYNAILTFDRLSNCADAVHTIQNACLDNIFSSKLNIKSPSSSSQNSIIAGCMISLQSPILFPSYMNSTLTSILSSIIPTPKSHYLSNSLWPGDLLINSTLNNVIKQNQNIMDIVNKALDEANYVSTVKNFDGVYLSLYNLFNGNLHPSTLSDCLQRATEKKEIKFSSWSIGDIDYNLVPKSISKTADYSLLSIANHTSFKTILLKIHSDFSQMIRRKAFANAFLREPMFEDFEEFERVNESLLNLLDEYKLCDEHNNENQYDI